MKVVNGEEVLEAAKGFHEGEARQHYYETQLKGKILVDEASIRSRFNYLRQHMDIDSRQGVTYPQYPTMDLFNLVKEIVGDVENEASK